MAEYTLPHRLGSEEQRLALMSALLDPLEQAYIANRTCCPARLLSRTRCGRSGGDGSGGRSIRASTTSSAQNSRVANSLGMKEVAGEGDTAHFNDGSDWARYWKDTMRELAPALLKSGHVSEGLVEEFHSHYQNRIIGPA